jgi:uncharacterized protein (DUF1810 family)
MAGPDDPFDLARFVDAQARTYETARAELRQGAKQSHWMWFIFPQLRGLGSSPMAVRFAIASLAEAEAYLAHRLLGPRLVECTGLVLAVEGRPIEAILPYPDHLKLHSSLTLFAEAAEGADKAVFQSALARYFGGEPDARTLRLLREG